MAFWRWRKAVDRIGEAPDGQATLNQDSGLPLETSPSDSGTEPISAFASVHSDASSLNAAPSLDQLPPPGHTRGIPVPGRVLPVPEAEAVGSLDAFHSPLSASPAVGSGVSTPKGFLGASPVVGSGFVTPKGILASSPHVSSGFVTPQGALSSSPHIPNGVATSAGRGGPPSGVSTPGSARSVVGGLKQALSASGEGLNKKESSGKGPYEEEPSRKEGVQDQGGDGNEQRLRQVAEALKAAAAQQERRQAAGVPHSGAEVRKAGGSRTVVNQERLKALESCLVEMEGKCAKLDEALGSRARESESMRGAVREARKIFQQERAAFSGLLSSMRDSLHKSREKRRSLRKSLRRMSAAGPHGASRGGPPISPAQGLRQAHALEQVQSQAQANVQPAEGGPRALQGPPVPLALPAPEPPGQIVPSTRSGSLNTAPSHQSPLAKEGANGTLALPVPDVAEVLGLDGVAVGRGRARPGHVRPGQEIVARPEMHVELSRRANRGGSRQIPAAAAPVPWQSQATEGGMLMTVDEYQERDNRLERTAQGSCFFGLSSLGQGLRRGAPKGLRPQRWVVDNSWMEALRKEFLDLHSRVQEAEQRAEELLQVQEEREELEDKLLKLLEMKEKRDLEVETLLNRVAEPVLGRLPAPDPSL